jgi:hypothetical protein
LNNKLIDSDKLLVLDNDEVYTIVWPYSSLTTKQVLLSLLEKDILPIASSSQSITIINNPEVKDTVLQLISRIGKVGS